MNKIRNQSDKEAFRLLMAQERRKEMELQRLTKHTLSLNKWEIYRQEREKAVDVFIKVLR